MQVAHFALATGEHDVARGILTAALEGRLMAQVAADGRQPHELARTRSFTYSLINLSGLLALAELGRRAGIDYWGYPAMHGQPGVGRLRAAIDHLAPYADPHRPWPHQQISPLKRSWLFTFLRQAQVLDGGRYGRAYDAWIRHLPAGEIERERANLLWPC